MTGIWIPAEILALPDISIQEMVFLSHILSLDNEGGCTANNEHFARLFKLTRVRVSTIISALSEKSYINVDIQKNAGCKRVIRVLKDSLHPIKENFNTPIKENDNTLLKDSLIPYSSKLYTPIKENFKHRINNKSNNRINIKTNKDTACADPIEVLEVDVVPSIAVSEIEQSPLNAKPKKKKEKSCAKKEKGPKPEKPDAEPYTNQCIAIYQEAYPEYFWNWGKDNKHVKGIIKRIRHKMEVRFNRTEFSETEVTQAFQWLITSDSWWKQKGITAPADYEFKFDKIYNSIVEQVQTSKQKASPFAPSNQPNQVHNLTDYGIYL